MKAVNVKLLKNISYLMAFTGMFIIVFLYSNSFSMSEENGEKLKLSLTTDKFVYTTSEEIKLSVALGNVSTEQLVVNKRMGFLGPEIFLEVINKSGQKLKWLPPGPPLPLTEADFIILQSGETITKDIDNFKIFLSEKLLPGGYSIQAIYKNRDTGDKFGLDAWTGELYSNIINIEVTD